MVKKFNFPTLSEWATFIDSIKNVAFALIFVIIGFYVTLHTELPVELVTRWVDVAMIVGSVYVGTRAVTKNNDELMQAIKNIGKKP